MPRLVTAVGTVSAHDLHSMVLSDTSVGIWPSMHRNATYTDRLLPHLPQELLNQISDHAMTDGTLAELSQ